MTFHNKTRTSQSIPRKLLRDGRPHLLPLYYLLRTSRLGREGIDNGGSYDFADHIYASKPQGRYLIGTLVDWALLQLPSVKSFRNRYLHAKQHLQDTITQSSTQELHILAAPSGYARELREIAQELREDNHPAYQRLRLHLLDLDEQLLDTLADQQRYAEHPFAFWKGDALDPETYTDIEAAHIVVSMGFTEFLDDTQVVEFYSNIHDHLRPGGVLITSGMKKHRLSEYMLRHLAELHTNYRDEKQLAALASSAGFASVQTYTDKHDIQTILIARK